ncbi:hypothetical protein ACFYVR_00885 [Rhodococcus sp. NPDC003318]
MTDAAPTVPDDVTVSDDVTVQAYFVPLEPLPDGTLRFGPTPTP